MRKTHVVGHLRHRREAGVTFFEKLGHSKAAVYRRKHRKTAEGSGTHDQKSTEKISAFNLG